MILAHKNNIATHVFILQHHGCQKLCQCLYTKSCGIMTSQIDVVTAVMWVYETGTFHFYLLQTGELEKKKEDTFRNNIKLNHLSLIQRLLSFWRLHQWSNLEAMY